MTDPAYPSSPGYQPVVPEPSVELDVFPPQEHSRWTVLLRLILIIPQAIATWFLGLAAVVVVICGWFGALFLGRLPEWCGEYLRGYYSYATRVYAYGMLLVDEYPPFAWNPPNYPVRVIFPAPTPLNRVAVFFRLILAFPILVLSSWFTAGWSVIAFIIWLIVLITGRMPQPIFEATASVVRIQLRTNAYTNLLTPTYLKGVFGDRAPLADPNLPPAQPASPTRPLWVSSSGRTLLIVILILGILASIAQSTVQSRTDDNSDTISNSQSR